MPFNITFREVIRSTILSIGSIGIALWWAPYFDKRPQSPDVETVLTLSKAASGGDSWNQIHSLHTTRMSQRGGVKRQIDEWNDVHTGRYVVSVQSFFTEARGYDGISSWLQPRLGQSYRLGDDDSRLSSVDNAYQVARAYWFQDRLRSTRQILGIRVEGARSFDVVQITPEGGRPFEIWFDTSTHLIDRFVEQEAEQISEIRFSDYRPIRGVMLPYRIQVGRAGSDDHEIETVTSIEANAPISDTAFSLPKPEAPDFLMDHGKTSTTIPFKLENNVILIPVRLNGQGPFWADFATGGSLIIQPKVASRLHLTSGTTEKSYGGGESFVVSGVSMVDRIQIGDASFGKIPADVFSIFDDAPEMLLVGQEILLRFAVRLDFDHKLMTLTPLSNFKYSGHGNIVPFHFQDNQPEVLGEVDGVAGVFTVDTGDNGSLLLIAPFAKKYNFYNRLNAHISYGGKAVGGGTYGVMGRAGRVSFSGSDGRPKVEVKGPITRLSMQQGGFDANRYVSGNIGVGIIKQFNVTFDYARQRIIFEKNRQYGVPDVYNRSGLKLHAHGTRWTVEEVELGGPADTLGFVVGDEIITIDGKDASAINRDALNHMFSQKPGTVVTIVLLVGKSNRICRLILKEIL